MVRVSQGSSVSSSASPGGGIIPGKLGRLGKTSYTIHIRTRPGAEQTDHSFAVG